MAPQDEHGITADQIARVSKFLRAQCTKDRRESWHVERSGIPQATFSSAKRGKKLGWETAGRLAEYFGWGTDVRGFLDGIEPAGYYLSHERGLAMGYPARGVVLDRFRGIVARGVLEEVQHVVLPQGSPAWSELQWARKVMDTVNEWERLGKNVSPADDENPRVGGQAPRPRK